VHRGREPIWAPGTDDGFFCGGNIQLRAPCFSAGVTAHDCDSDPRGDRVSGERCRARRLPPQALRCPVHETAPTRQENAVRRAYRSETSGIRRYCRWSSTEPVIVAVLPTLTGVTVSVVPSTQYEYSCSPAVIVSVLPATV